jgi:predicted secreted hydrolase
MMFAPMTRRAALLQALALPAWALSPQGISRRPLQFPRDFGAHPDTGLEWWYLTGLLGTDEASAPLFGYQLTFFRLRNRDPAVQAHPSVLAPRQLLLAHVALSDLRAGRLTHDQRLGRSLAGAVQASEADCDVRLRDWFLKRTVDDDYHASFGSSAAGFALQLELHSPQAPLLQGDAGYSRKGPEEAQASHYYSRPQLITKARLSLAGKSAQQLSGRSWLDHEWSDSLLAPEAVGWDWLGLNLLDGGALTAFRLRRANGSSLWTGGSWRGPDGRTQVFGNGELRFEPGRRWRSPASLAEYPVVWTLVTPAQTLQVRALLDAQEVDARSSSGMQYWEGASEVLDSQGRLIGRGYLEMTGYAKRMALPG